MSSGSTFSESANFLMTDRRGFVFWFSIADIVLSLTPDNLANICLE